MKIIVLIQFLYTFIHYTFIQCMYILFLYAINELFGIYHQ